MLGSSVSGARRAVGLVLAVFLLSCGRRASDPPGRPGRGAPPPSIDLRPDVDDPWIPVHPGAVEVDEPIYWQLCGTGAPPRLVARRPLLVPLEADAVPRGVLIVRAVVGRKGYVARAQLLRVLPLPSHLSWEGPVAEALRGFRFWPAFHGGEPVAVYYNLTLMPESAFDHRAFPGGASPHGGG